MDRDAHRQTEKQRAKVLQDLWKMDDHGIRPTKTPKKPVDLSDLKVDTRKNKSDNDSSWQELLEKKKEKKIESKKRSSPQSDDSSKSSSIRNDERDLDLVPDRDWSTRSSDEVRKPADANKEKVDVVVESTSKRQQFKKKRQKTLERQASYAKEENPDYIRNLVTNLQFSINI